MRRPPCWRFPTTPISRRCCSFSTCEVALVITQLDAGMSLSEYLTQSSKPLSFTAIRSILGEVVEALHVLQKDNLTHFSISTDTVRLTRNGIEIADAPVSIMLADTSRVQSVENQEQLAIRQVASLLYSLLTRTPSTLSTNYHLDAGSPTVPMATIAELEALLGDYEPLAKLNGPDIALPSADSECSIVNVPLLQILEQDAIALPDTLAETGSIPEMTFEAPEPHTDFSDSKEALAKGMAATGGAVKSLWNNSRELLSEEDLDGSSEDVDSPFSFPIRVSTPSPQGDYHTDDSQLEKTGRIPVIGPDGRVIEPGEESARALKAEQEAIDAAYQNENGTPVAVPPSFAPKASSSSPAEVANAKLFGKLTTKVVAIVVAFIVVAVALGFAIHGLTKKPDDGITNTNSNNPWPEMNLDDVPFGDNGDSGNGSSSASDANSDSNDANSSDNGSSDSSKPKKTTKKSHSAKKDVDKVVTSDKKVRKVPEPKMPENTTPYEIDNRQFLSNPDGQQGYGYYLHLSQPQKAYRMVIKIRSSGGQGYIRVNAKSSPNQGEQVAQFEFDASGTTEIKFNKAVETQDILLWVPFDSLPGNQLYIDSVQIF